MLSGEFQRKLRSLNRKLRVFCGDSSTTPAGIFLLTPDGYEDIMGVDKNYVPEHSEFNENGSIRKGGWRRVLRLLIQRRLIDRWHAERVFNTHLEYAPRIPRVKRIDPAKKEQEFLDKYGAFMDQTRGK